MWVCYITILDKDIEKRKYLDFQPSMLTWHSVSFLQIEHIPILSSSNRSIFSIYLHSIDQATAPYQHPTYRWLFSSPMPAYRDCAHLLLRKQSTKWLRDPFDLSPTFSRYLKYNFMVFCLARTKFEYGSDSSTLSIRTNWRNVIAYTKLRYSRIAAVTLNNAP